MTEASPWSQWTVWAPIFIVFFVVIISTFITRGSAKAYGSSSPYTPPSWVFGVVWGILYIGIAIAWVRANIYLLESFTLLNWIFTINILLNMFWSLIAFGEKDWITALVILTSLVIITGILIYLVRHDGWALIFVTLYFIWLCYALFLNWYLLSSQRI